MIKLIKSTFYSEEYTKDRLCAFIKETPVMSMGQECKKLEEAFATRQERKYAVFVSSGSAANLILIQALLNLGLLSKGDRVAISSLTWATNVMPLIQLGLQPIALDCDLSNLNVSSKILKNFEHGSVKALFLTNVLGFCADIDQIKNYCLEKEMIFLEDNCESLGSKVKNKLLGNFGLASTFSTFVGHHISTIEGGFVCTDNEELYEMLLMVRAHGWGRNLNHNRRDRLQEENNLDEFHARYTFYDLAYNVRPTEIQGFIGNIQLSYWDEIVLRRQENFFRFLERTRTNTDIVPLDISHMSLVSNFAMPLVFKDKSSFRKYKDRFESKGVEIRPIIAGNIARQPFFKKHVILESECSNSDAVHENGFYFANNPELTEEELVFLCSLLSG